MREAIPSLALGVVLALVAACDGAAEAPGWTPLADETPSPAANGLSLTSEAFSDGATIPTQYTCDGDDLSPPLAWSGAPAGTQSFALVVDDPDAPGGTFTHWLLYGVSAGAMSLPEGVDTAERPASGGVQGGNDAGGSGYAGPCPPPGDPHRYRFTLYALDGPVGLGPGASKDDLLSAMEGRVLAQAELVGLYGR